jgi:hypothetical protein
MKREHKAVINAERDSYYVRIAKATQNPEQFLSLIVDGADQKKNALPHHAKEGKGTSGLWKQPVHNYGVLSHGRQAFSFLCNDSMKQGTNVTIEVVHRVLLHTLKMEGKLPDVMFVQLDNTTKQCKSRYLMAYMASLLASGVFKRILVSFLPVGHTHEDVDQLFSTFSRALNFLNAYTREELAAVIKGAFNSTAYKHPIHVEQMDAIVNYSDFVEEMTCIPEGISRWYQFRFYKEDGVVKLQCRESTTDGSWGGICATEVRDHLTTTVFKAGMDGRILPGVNIPPAQRRDPYAPAHADRNDDTTKVKLYRVALEKFTVAFALNPVQVASLSKDIDAVASVAPVPFHWSDDDIALLYGNGAEVEEAKQPGGIPDVQEAVFKMVVNKFYIYKTDPVEGQDQGATVPFRLSLCLQHGSMLDDLIGDNLLYPGAYMLEYIASTPDWTTCKWSKGLRQRSMQRNPFQWDTAVTPWPMSLLTTGKLSATSVRDVGYYLQRWARPDLSEDWPEQEGGDQAVDRGNMLALGKRKPKKTTGNKKRRRK